MAIYKENCFTEAESECLEGCVFYRLISGFHASTTAHITEYFTSSTNVWQPNVDMFVWRLGLFPDRLKNIYFAFAFLLRYVESASSLAHASNPNHSLTLVLIVRQAKPKRSCDRSITRLVIAKPMPSLAARSTSVRLPHSLAHSRTRPLAQPYRVATSTRRRQVTQGRQDL